MKQSQLFSRKAAVCFAVFSFLLGMAVSASIAPAPALAQQEQNGQGQNQNGQGRNGQGPLVLKAQGNFYVGGTIQLRTPNTTAAALPGDGTAPGHIAVGQGTSIPSS